MPRHFNLLWDEDLEELREVLIAVRDRRTEVVSVWFDLYQSHFGDRCSLTATEFRAIFEPVLLTNKEFLLNKDIDGYVRSTVKLGETLVEHHVPLQEIIASLRLFEEAAQTGFPIILLRRQGSLQSSTSSATSGSSCWSVPFSRVTVQATNTTAKPSRT